MAVLEFKSKLPPPAEVVEVLKIRRVPLDATVDKGRVETHLKRVTRGLTSPMDGQLYSIDNDDVRGYLPSKLFLVNSGFEVMFYTNPKLPDTARPFKQGKTHIIITPVYNNEVIEYEADLRILIDQVVEQATLGDTVNYIFVFGDEQYDDVVSKMLGA